MSGPALTLTMEGVKARNLRCALAIWMDALVLESVYTFFHNQGTNVIFQKGKLSSTGYVRRPPLRSSAPVSSLDAK